MIHTDSRSLSMPAAWRGLTAIMLVLAAPALVFIYMNRPTLAIVPLLVVPLLILVATPRWTLFLFVLTWGVYLPYRMGLVALHPMDIAFALLLLGTVLEYLLRQQTLIYRTGFDLAFLALIAATVLSAIFAYNTTLSLVPVLRIIVVYAAFRVLFKMAREIGVRKMLRFYLAFVFVLSIISAVELILSGGRVRVFGPSFLGIQYFVMTAIPMSLSFFIWSTSSRDRIVYATYVLVMAVAMLATQSRAPLVATAVSVPVLLIAAGRKSRAMPDPVIRYNLRLVWLLLILAGVGVVAFGGNLFTGAFERTQEFVTSYEQPKGTVALRLLLWRAALDAFLAHPVFGIGIGNFRIVHEIMPRLELIPLWRYVHGMSAHNVILHYLAETGIVGTAALITLAVGGLRSGIHVFRKATAAVDAPVATALFISMFVFVITLTYMRAWTWGQGGYLMAFLFALSSAWQRERSF